jgi:hypothetical protein
VYIQSNAMRCVCVDALKTDTNRNIDFSRKTNARHNTGMAVSLILFQNDNFKKLYGKGRGKNTNYTTLSSGSQ